jgi:hypothetical protein
LAVPFGEPATLAEDCQATLGRTWGRRGKTPVGAVTGGSNKRVSLAALIAVKPDSGPG